MSRYVEIIAHKPSMGEFHVPVDDYTVFAYSLSRNLHNETVALFNNKNYINAATNCVELKQAFGGVLEEYYKSFISDIQDILKKEID